MPTKKYMRAKEAAKMISVSASTIRRYARMGKIPSKKMGTALLIPVDFANSLSSAQKEKGAEKVKRDRECVEGNFVVVAWNSIVCSSDVFLPFSKRQNVVDQFYNPELSDISNIFIEFGWAGEGKINCIWVPSFIAQKCTEPDSFGDLFYHVEQKSNSMSLLLMPMNVFNVTCFADKDKIVIDFRVKKVSLKCYPSWEDS